MSSRSLIEVLYKYAGSGICPMHMPGHKRNIELLGESLPYRTDITEITGFDNLQDPEGILKEIAGLAADLYGSEMAYLSVNGSTGAILAAVRSCTKPYDKIIMARNCHMSVYNAAEINILHPVYVNTPINAETGIAGSVKPENMCEVLGVNPDSKLVIITSPTYEGISSDVRGITEAAHEFGIPVLVDAAHGAHLGFSDFFGESAIQAGADLVVMSLHKTLPTLTQCALLHYQNSKLGYINRLKLQNAVNTFQTSSPSYILLSSIDACLRLIKADGQRLFHDYEVRLRRFIDNMKKLRHLSLFCPDCDSTGKNAGIFSFDPGKLAVITRSANISGSDLAASLRNKYGIETEMAAQNYIIAMTSICDTDENFNRFATALLEIDSYLQAVKNILPIGNYPIPQAATSPFELIGEEDQTVNVMESEGRISNEYVWAYPPGIPLIVPGEVIPSWLPELSKDITSGKNSCNYHSSKGGFPGSICCIK